MIKCFNAKKECEHDRGVAGEKHDYVSSDDKTSGNREKISPDRIQPIERLFS